MKGSAVAKRYAKALFEVALEKNLLDQVEQDLHAVVQAFEATPELLKWLSHPETDVEKKKEVFASLFKEAHETVRNLLFLLGDRRREGIIADIYADFKSLADEARGVAEATVTTAFPLSDKEKEQLVQVFQPMIGKKIRITEKVDSDILGGVIVQVGDKLYDGSLRTKLIRFQERLKGTRVG
jgi:F-type H+-transporting ATPase subunit delta